MQNFDSAQDCMLTAFTSGDGWERCSNCNQ